MVPHECGELAMTIIKILLFVMSTFYALNAAVQEAPKARGQFFGVLRQSDEEAIDDDAYSEGDALIDEIIDKTVKSIKKKYAVVRLQKESVLSQGLIGTISMHLEMCKEICKEDARKILVATAKEFMQNVSHSSKIKQFLKHPPFALEDLQIVLYCYQENMDNDDSIALADMTKGTLNYITVDCHNNFACKEYRETYEEAVQALSL